MQMRMICVITLYIIATLVLTSGKLAGSFSRSVMNADYLIMHSNMCVASEQILKFGKAK